MNLLRAREELQNQYWLMRHGQSQANVAGIIVSNPEKGVLPEYGLTELGRMQVRRSIGATALTSNTVIICSDFSRARESAEIVRKAIGAPAVETSKALRERNFGSWDGTEDENYQKVWYLDATDPAHIDHGVESVNSVLTRTTGKIVELEQQYIGRNILLVSHGDTLQILQTGFAKEDPSMHRSLLHLEVAEIRPVQLVRSE